MRSGVVTKAIVFDEDGKVLLIRRSADDDRRPGEWDFPGGGVEEHEECGAALVREIAEEAGLVVAFDDVTLVYGHTGVVDGVSVTRLVYVVRAPRGQAVKLSFEHDICQWVAAKDVSTVFPHHVYGSAVDYVLANKVEF